MRFSRARNIIFLKIKKIQMDFGTAITALIVIVITILPFLLVTLSNKKTKKQILKELITMSNLKNSTVTQFDLWNNSALGIDSKGRTLHYFRKTNGEAVWNHVDLSEVQRCRLLDQSRPVNELVNDLSIERLELAFTHFKKEKEDILLEFYNKEYDGIQAQHELLLAKKWSDIVNQRLEILQQS
jgi:hypothetical protein